MGERQLTFEDGAHTVLEWWGLQGPVILCVHGITSSRRSWSRLGERLASEFRTFAYDQRGHGDAAAADTPMTLDRSVRDLERVAAELPPTIDLLIGHSWGGAVAILAGRQPAIRKVLAIDPMIRVPAGTFEADYVDDLRGTLALEPGLREPAIREMYAGADPADVAGKVHAMVPMRIAALERLGQENRADAGGWDLREHVADYPKPLALFVAGEDSVISADDLTFVRERGGPNVSLRIFEGQGHNLQRTAFDDFVLATRAFAG